MSHSVVVKFAPVFTAERFDNPAENRDGRDLYANGALRFPLKRKTVPLMIDHEHDREIGIVHELFKMDWTDGPWLCARATVTEPPSWLKRGTRASFALSVFERRAFQIRGTQANYVAGAFVNEVSVLSPSVRPAEPLAEVLLFERSSPAAVLSSDRVAAGEYRRPAAYDELERIVGYRITDENFEAALIEVRRRPLDKAYDEILATRRHSSPLLVRRNIGQVLAVR